MVRETNAENSSNWVLFIIVTCNILVSFESLYGIWPSLFLGSAKALTTAFRALILKTGKFCQQILTRAGKDKLNLSQSTQ